MLDISYIEAIIKDKKNKFLSCFRNVNLIKQLSISMNDLFVFLMEKCNQHEVAQIIKSHQHFIDRKGKSNNINYQIRQIILVELGVNGNNFSYKHPCVVIKNFNNKLFVVPCTSSPAPKDETGNIYSGYLEGTVAEGFDHLTTLLLKEVRFIDKTQVIHPLKDKVTKKYKKISTGFYNTLYNELFKIMFSSKQYEIDVLTNKNTELLEKINTLEQELEEIKQINEESLEPVAVDEEKKIS